MMCSIIGVPDFFSSKSLIARLMWFISILLSVGFTFYLIISSITAYYDYDTVSKVEVFYPPEIHFPAVTMCFRYVKDQKNILFMKKKFNNEVLDNYILDSVKVQPSLFLSSDSPKCCFRFNGGDLSSPITFFKSERSYSVGGFKINIYLPPDEQDTTINIYIDNNTVFPIDYEVQSTPKLGYMTFIEIEKTVQNSLGNPYSDCVSINDIASYDSELVRETLNSGYLYRQKNCIETCSEKNDSLYNKSQSFFNRKICSKSCPIECEMTKYRVIERDKKIDLQFLNYDGIDEKTFESFNLKNMTKEKFISGLRVIYVYFPYLQYTKITQKPKTTEVDLASSIGGSLGLFLGMSFLSFIQLFQIIYETILLMKQKIF